MYLFITVLHVILCILLVLIILLQPGKGGDVGSAFGGGGGGGGMFGPRGPATLLSRATTGVAVLFMVTSVGLALLSDQSMLSDEDVDNLLEDEEEPTDYAMPGSARTPEPSVDSDTEPQGDAPGAGAGAAE